MTIRCDNGDCRYHHCPLHIDHATDMEESIASSDLSGGDWKRCEHLPLVAGGQGRADDTAGAAVWAIVACIAALAIMAGCAIIGRL